MRSGFVCLKCGAEIGIFLGKAPIDPKICEDSDRGTPFIAEHANSSATKAFMEIVRKIEDFLINEKTQPQKVMRKEGD